MDTGTKISGAAHVVLIGWALLGGQFDSEPLPMATQEVAIISAEDFAALTTQPETPELTTEPQAPQAPEDTSETPDVSSREDTRPEPVQPEAQEVPEQETLPEADPTPLPPEAEVREDVATLVTPALPEPDTALTTERPVPRPVERVAPEPVAAPPPDVRPDPVPVPDTAPDPQAETPREEEVARQPEEAVDEIVPEPDPQVSTLAPSVAPRPPRTRPRPPAPRVAETAPPQETPTQQPQPDRSDAVAAALSEALQPAESEAQGEPAGPPLSLGEKDALRVAVSNCWNAGSLSTAAAATTVVVGVDMARDGRPVVSSIRLVSSSGGSGDAVSKAFEAARRAIIRCGARGYDLPAEKYAHWREVEMTFALKRVRVE